MQRIGINLEVQTDLEIYHTSINDFIRRMYCILLIFYQAVSPSLTGDTFLLLLPLTTPQTRRKILPSSDLFDEKTKIFLTRILQRRARYPELIPSYWDNSTQWARLRFSYAPPSQPTFDSYPQDCLLSCCFLIRGFTGPECYQSILNSQERSRLDSHRLDTNILICRCIATEEDF